MAFSRQNRPHTLNGILFVALFALAATYVANLPIFHRLAISPLIIGIILGMFYANTLRMHLPEPWIAGILFSTKTLLRAGIVLFGFRVTFQQIMAVGPAGFFASTAVVVITLGLGYVLGRKVFKLDRETALLTSSGSAICGAAAVLATEGVLENESYKSAVAVGTVVLFGTISMFLYPLFYRLGFIPLDVYTEGIYIGSTIHEVAQVVGAGSAISAETAQTAVIVKMIRIMLLVPFLLGLGLVLRKTRGAEGADARDGRGAKLSIPWFALGFLVMAGVNSLDILPKGFTEGILTLDTFLLTMAMTALGMETSLDKFRGVGGRAIVLAFVLFVWLNVGGFFIAEVAGRM